MVATATSESHAPMIHDHAEAAAMVHELARDLAGEPRALQVLRELVQAHTAPSKSNMGDDLERYTTQCLHYIGFALDRNSHPSAPEAGERMQQLHEALSVLEGPVRFESAGISTSFASRVTAAKESASAVALGRS